MTEMYLDAVDAAVAKPGVWVEVPRQFRTRYNAEKTGSCLQGGYLRVQPREGDVPIQAEGQLCIKTAAPVTPRIESDDDVWKLSIRYGG
jgi:hypothetical protein